MKTIKEVEMLLNVYYQKMMGYFGFDREDFRLLKYYT